MDQDCEVTSAVFVREGFCAEAAVVVAAESRFVEVLVAVSEVLFIVVLLEVCVDAFEVGIAFR